MKNSPLTESKYLFLCFLILGLVLWSFLGNFQKASSGKVSANEFSQETKKWKGLIEKEGGDEAYGDFKKTYQASDPGTQHSMAHIFGSALYETVGLKGVEVCDNDFAFGCFHSFFGTALSKEGLKITKTLDDYCLEKYGSKYLPCQHGLGHGVLYYLGEAKLSDALEECKKISWQSLGGCTSGIFMEYNFRTMASPTGLLIRPLNDKPNYPCDTVGKDFQGACYFEQAQWWEVVLNQNYQKMGSLCDQVTSSEAEIACFEGIGNYSATTAGYDQLKTQEVCNSMVTQNGKLGCALGAGWIILGQPNSQTKALAMCSILEGSFLENCTEKIKTNAFFN